MCILVAIWIPSRGLFGQAVEQCRLKKKDRKKVREKERERLGLQTKRRLTDTDCG